jgi:cytochrome oxidase Cu insertion factor (SCO1/SenC/PrrC family)
VVGPRSDSRVLESDSMRPLTISWTVIAVLAGVTSGAPQSNPTPRARVDVSKLGPQVGERVPDFNLKDQNGRSWTLQSIMGPKGAMLVFFRSADW